MVDTGEEPQTTRVLRVKLQTADKTILLYSASDIEMLTRTTDHASVLQRVGPDVLDPNLTPEVVKERLLSPRFRNRQFAGLLLDQAFLAGLGNYLRVEILWQVGLTGNHKAKISMRRNWMHSHTRYRIFRDFLTLRGAGG